MNRLPGRILSGLFGWKVINTVPKEIKKAVLIGAPHTTNFDLMVALMVIFSSDRSFKYLMKKEVFKGPLNWIFRWTGGIPVDRKSDNTEFVKNLKSALNDSDELFLTFAPEGTRSYTERWKTGFYRIASDLNIPIVLGTADYERKEVRIQAVFWPTGNLNMDFRGFEKHYKGVQGRFPEKFNPVFQAK